MTPDASRASYRRHMALHGSNVTFKRTYPNVPNKPDLMKPVRVRVSGYTQAELTAGASIGDRKIILTAEDAQAATLPQSFKKGSDAFVLADGTELTIESVDDQTRRINGVLIAYEIKASGA